MRRGRVADDIPVPLARPRDEDERASKTAVEISKRILHHLALETPAAAPALI